MNDTTIPAGARRNRRRTQTSNRSTLLAVAAAGLLLFASAPATSLTGTAPMEAGSAALDADAAAACAVALNEGCAATEDQDGAVYTDDLGLGEETRLAKDQTAGEAHTPTLPKKKLGDEDPPRGAEAPPEGPPHVSIPRGFPGYYEPPAKGELFAPGEYHVLCVPRPDATTDHFVVDADSLRILEFVTGDVKLSEYGFLVASCDLPWDVPWPA